MTPEIIIAFGTAAAAALGAVFGGKNSLNGFKQETRASFKEVNDRAGRIENKVDHLAISDALQTERTGVNTKRLRRLEQETKRVRIDLEEERKDALLATSEE